jgi:hypothetical protein
VELYYISNNTAEKTRASIDVAMALSEAVT